MIVFAGVKNSDRRFIGLGLTESNIELLREGKPIEVDSERVVDDLQLDIVVVLGNDEESVMRTIKPFANLDTVFELKEGMCHLESLTRQKTRSIGEIQRAHDVVEGALRFGQPPEYVERSLKGALDIFCWILGHESGAKFASILEYIETQMLNQGYVYNPTEEERSDE